MRVPDYVGLLCRYPAKSGGLSRFCSLYTVHERMEARYPAELRRLYQPMHFDRQAEHAEGAAKTSFAPFFSWSGGKLRCRANSSLVRKGYQVHGSEMDAGLVDALRAWSSSSSSPPSTTSSTSSGRGAWSGSGSEKSIMLITPLYKVLPKKTGSRFHTKHSTSLVSC